MNDEMERADYPVTLRVRPSLEDRNRLTTAFRFFLALPHILLVGLPLAAVGTVSWDTESGLEFTSGGLVTAVIGVLVVLAWLALLVTARYPDPLRRAVTWYLRWRVKAAAYYTLLRDEYPPFGEGTYPVEVELPEPAAPQSRLTVLFRFWLALPHLFVLGFLSVAWAFATAVAWSAIILTGRYPKTLYGFSIGVLAWATRVEAYMLLLRDEYPPFTLRT